MPDIYARIYPECGIFYIDFFSAYSFEEVRSRGGAESRRCRGAESRSRGGAESRCFCPFADLQSNYSFKCKNYNFILIPKVKLKSFDCSKPLSGHSLKIPEL